MRTKERFRCTKPHHTRSMMEPGCLFLAHTCLDRVLLEVVDGLLHVPDQELSQVTADAESDQDALNHLVFAVRRKRIRRNLPTIVPKPVGEVVEGVVTPDPLLEIRGSCTG